MCLCVFVVHPSVPARAQEDALPRSVAGLKLGDSVSSVRRKYPPSRPWPCRTSRRGRERGCLAEKAWAERFPAGVETLRLVFRDDRLAEIVAVYDDAGTRAKPVNELARRYALDHGEPRRTDEGFAWADERTVLRVYSAEVTHTGRVKALRTAVRLADAPRDEE